MNAEPRTKVALVAAFPPPPAGMTHQAEMLAELLAREGAEVVRVNTNPFGRRKPRLKRFLYVLRELPRLRGCDLALVFAGSFASFVAFTAVPLLAARLLGVPALILYKGSFSRPFFKRWGFFVRAVVRRARGVVVPGQFLADVFAAFGMQAVVIPDIIKIPAVGERAPAPPERPVILNTRRHVPVCGVDIAVAAFAKVRREFPQAELHLYGDGPERRSLAEKAASIGGVRFFGFVPHEALADAYRVATLLVNANRDDNHPNSILEAMAVGVPVVATTVGGVPYLVADGETGFLAPTEDADALAEKIIYTLRNPKEAERVAANARRVVGKFIWPYDRPGILKVLVEVARLGRAGGRG